MQTQEFENIHKLIHENQTSCQSHGFGGEEGEAASQSYWGSGLKNTKCKKDPLDLSVSIQFCSDMRINSKIYHQFKMISLRLLGCLRYASLCSSPREPQWFRETFQKPGVHNSSSLPTNDTQLGQYYLLSRKIQECVITPLFKQPFELVCLCELKKKRKKETLYCWIMLQLAKFQEGKHSGLILHGHITWNITFSVWLITNLLERWYSFSVFLQVSRRKSNLCGYYVARGCYRTNTGGQRAAKELSSQRYLLSTSDSTGRGLALFHNSER